MVETTGIFHYFRKGQKIAIFIASFCLTFASFASETGAIYRAKRGPDSYFKSVEYKKTILISYVDLWAEHFDLPIHIIKGQVEQESGWDNNIVSYKGAKGLMQIMPSTAYCKGNFCLKADMDESLHNPYTNVYYGCMYMRMLLDYYNQDLDLALMAYYGGMGRVNKIINNELNSNSLEAEIRKYASDVREKSINYLELDEFAREIIDNVQPIQYEIIQ